MGRKGSKERAAARERSAKKKARREERRLEREAAKRLALLDKTPRGPRDTLDDDPF